MTHLPLELPLDTVRDIGWTLIHFLWQGLILATALQVVLPICRGTVTRHNWALGVLGAMAITPVATFLVIHGRKAIAAPPASGATLQNINDATATLATTSIPPSWIEWLVAFWLAGIVVLSMRALGGWYLAETLRRRDTLPVSSDLLQRCRALQQRLGLTSPVEFLQSRGICELAVVGWFRPTVLLPISAITGLPSEYLDALIAHELAHIRRFDAFSNLMVIAVETILFYHPAVWWVGRRVRIEREQCCDDIAVSICGDAAVYVEALTTLETWRAAPAFALAANGGRLRQRAARLLGVLPESRRFSISAVAGLFFLGLVGAGYAVAQNDTPAANQNSAISAVGDNDAPGLQQSPAIKPSSAPSIKSSNETTTAPALPRTGLRRTTPNLPQGSSRVLPHWARDGFPPPPMLPPEGWGVRDLGTVDMTATIELDGSIKVVVDRSSGRPEVDEFCKALITTPQWLPGTVDGVPQVMRLSFSCASPQLQVKPASLNPKGAATGSPPEFQRLAGVLMRADSVVSQDDQMVTATGHVMLNYNGRVLKADRVVYDRNGDMMTATGNVTYTRSGATLTAGRAEIADPEHLVSVKLYAR